MNYINVIICLNTYFEALIRVIVLCKVKDSSLGSRGSVISAGIDYFTSYK